MDGWPSGLRGLHPFPGQCPYELTGRGTGVAHAQSSCDPAPGWPVPTPPTCLLRSHVLFPQVLRAAPR